MYDREYYLEEKEWLKSHGICTRCKKQDADPGHSLCLICRMDARGRKKPRTEEQKRQHAENMRRFYAEKRAAGLCMNCSKPAYQGHAHCYHHYIYYKRKGRQQNAKRSNNYAELGLCRICGGERREGSKLCETHYQQYAEQMRAANQKRSKEWKSKIQESAGNLAQEV